MACIYIATNKINNKIYVGQTIHTAKQRMLQHKYDKSLLGKAIRKYGKDNFHIKEYSDIRIEWLDWFEQNMIQHCKSLTPNGYNIHLGGQENRFISDETKKKISKAKKGSPSPNKGKKMTEEQKKENGDRLRGRKWTEEQKANLSKIRRASPEKYAHMKGKKHSEETKRKMSESAKKVPHTKEWNKNVGLEQIGRVGSCGNRGHHKIYSQEEKEAQSIRMKLWWKERKENTLLEVSKEGK